MDPGSFYGITQHNEPKMQSYVLAMVWSLLIAPVALCAARKGH